MAKQSHLLFENWCLLSVKPMDTYTVNGFPVINVDTEQRKAFIDCSVWSKAVKDSIVTRYGIMYFVIVDSNYWKNQYKTN